jgi:hypothetical protein
MSKKYLSIITLVDPYSGKIKKMISHPEHTEVRDLFKSVRQLEALPIIRVHQVNPKDELTLVEHDHTPHLATFQIIDEHAGPVGCQFLLLLGESTLTNQFIDVVGDRLQALSWSNEWLQKYEVDSEPIIFYDEDRKYGDQSQHNFGAAMNRQIQKSSDQQETPLLYDISSDLYNSIRDSGSSVEQTSHTFNFVVLLSQKSNESQMRFEP